jgi:hypothetical protein
MTQGCGDEGATETAGSAQATTSTAQATGASTGGGGEGGTSSNGSAGSAGSGGVASGSGGSGGVFEPDPSCEYGVKSEAVASCDGDWTIFFEMEPIGGNCPSFYTSGETAFADLRAAFEGLDCDPSCVYVALGAALFVHCEQKGEATTLSDGGPLQTEPPGSCADLIYVDWPPASGFYASLREFNNENPCP